MGVVEGVGDLPEGGALEAFLDDSIDGACGQHWWSAQADALCATLRKPFPGAGTDQLTQLHDYRAADLTREAADAHRRRMLRAEATRRVTVNGRILAWVMHRVTAGREQLGAAGPGGVPGPAC